MIKLIVLIIIFLFPTSAYASGLSGLMMETFSAGGKGAVISTILALAIGSWVLEQLTQIIGKTNFGNWIKLTAMFIALSLFVGTSISVINKIVSYILP